MVLWLWPVTLFTVFRLTIYYAGLWGATATLAGSTPFQRVYRCKFSLEAGAGEHVSTTQASKSQDCDMRWCQLKANSLSSLDPPSNITRLSGIGRRDMAHSSCLFTRSFDGLHDLCRHRMNFTGGIYHRKSLTNVLPRTQTSGKLVATTSCRRGRKL